MTLFFAFYTLLLSAVSKNRRYVSILIFGVYLFSDVLYNIFNGIFHSQYFSLLSIRSNLRQLGAVFFGQSLPFDIPWFLSLLVVFLWCGASILVLGTRVKGVEVVK